MSQKLRLLTAVFFLLSLLSAVSFGTKDLFGQEPSPGGESSSNVQSSSPSETDPVAVCEKMISENALYSDALNTLRPWVLAPETDSPSLSRAIELSCAALEQLNRTGEIDVFLEEAVKSHPRDWRVLAAAARQYSALNSFGSLIDGKFCRGVGLGSNRTVDSSERDRVRAMQLYTEGMKLLEAQRAAPGVSPEEVCDFYNEFARTCLDVGSNRAYLQKLTDLETLPDYRRETGYAGWNVPSYPPVDDQGNPVFYEIPESFEAARNDGERWRFLLDKAASSGAPDASNAHFLYANFLMEEFGSGSLGIPEPLPSEGEQNGENPLAALGSLASLSDDETIARLADGIKRFKFPEGQNPLRIYRGLMEDPSVGIDTQIRAAVELGRAYLNRTQYLRAEEVYRRLVDLEIKAELPPHERFARGELDNLTGSYGAFAPIAAKAAGTPVSFLWKYRNGKKVRFRAQEINIRLFLQDAMNYLEESAKNPPEDWQIEKLRIEEVGWKLLNDNSSNNKYLSSDVADWSVDLNPAADHHDCQISIDFPVTKPGAYLLRGKMENGNSDAIVIWISDTAILKKQVEGKTFWYVGDAKTGAPIPEARLRFFGYTVNRMPDYRGEDPRNEGAADSRDSRRAQSRWQVQTKELEKQTNSDGWLFTDTDEMNLRFRWLAEASVPTEDGGGRYAYYGFEDIWYSHGIGAAPFGSERACFLSDRPIYRPKDTIHFRFQAGTARYDQPEEWNWRSTPALLTVTGPGGKELISKEITLDETGGWEDTLETDESFNLGVYTFRLDVLHTTTRQESGADGTRWRELGFGTVSLEEYRKPEFEVKVETPEKPVALGEKISVKARADYYFGSPVTHAGVSWRVTRRRVANSWYPVCRWDWLYGNGYAWLAPSAPWYPGWTKWGCLPPPMPWHPFYHENSELVASGKTEIGEDGSVEIPIDTASAAQLYPGDDQSYEVTVEVTDDSRRLAVGTGKVIVVRKPFRVTTWTERGFYEPGQQITCAVAARRADGAAVGGIGRATVSRVRLSDDPERPEMKKVDETPIISDEIPISSEGAGNLSFILDEPGLYRFRCVVDDAGGHQIEGGSLITVIGAGGRTPEEAAASNPIDIVPEKPEYRPGETARLRVSCSADDATALLFVRSEGNDGGAPHILPLKGGSALYEVEITDADMPNIWIEAVTISGGRVWRTARNVPVPPISRVLDVQIEPEESSYKPGECARMKVRVTDPDGKPVSGVITAAVYDRSLDGLMSRPAVDLKKFFWNWTRQCASHEQHNLDRWFYPLDFPQKNTMQPLSSFDWQYENAAEDGVGGGAAFSPVPMKSRSLMALSRAANGIKAKEAALGTPESPAAAPMEAQTAGVMADVDAEEAFNGEGSDASKLPDPEIRTEFADTALWVGRLQTDENGEAELSCEMPEDITSWNIRVWSFAPGTRVGEGTAEIVTRKDLFLRMERPRFLTQTDTVLLSAVVHNYTSTPQSGEVTLQIDPDAETDSAIRLHDGASPSRKVRIPPGGQTRVDWQVDAASAANVPLVMTVRTPGGSDGVRESIPVYLHGIRKQESFAGTIPSVEEGKTAQREYSFRVTVPEERIPEETSLTVRYSPSLAGAIIDAIPYLTDYPYGCTEQTLNRFLPTVLVRKYLAGSGIDLAEIASHRANLNAQELGDPETRRPPRRQRINIFGEPIAESAPPIDPVFSEDEVNRRVEEGVARLGEMQCADGGWGWFGGGGEHSDAHLTALVTDGLIQAKFAGVVIPDDMLQGGLGWLRGYLFTEHAKLKKWRDETQTPDVNHSPDAKQYASVYDVQVFQTLEGWGQPGSDEEGRMLAEMSDFIFDSRAALPPYALALYAGSLSFTKPENRSAAHRQRLDAVLNMLGQYLKTDETNQTAWLDLRGTSAAGLWWRWYGNDIETQAEYLSVMSREKPKDPALPMMVKYLLNNRKNATYWDSTRDTAHCLAAFTEYLNANGELKQSGTVEILVDGKVVKTESITPETVFASDHTFVLSGEEIDAGPHEVTIRFSGAGPLYCCAYLANFTMEPFIRKAGLEVAVDRTYWKLTEDESASETAVDARGQLTQKRVHKFRRDRLEDGAPIESGDLVEVELNIRSKNDYESILIEDRKPAGFEPTNPVSGYTNDPLNAYTEYRDARVSFFVHRLPQGTHTLTYRLRAETPGTVSALPAAVEGMYAPELRGNSDEFQTTVND
ncbi:MAG: hypothetical protein J6S42_05670 [Thermoguttaceae bacterium]|nr:hypothetical protein [Thermoguttaceae bacterium]